MVYSLPPDCENLIFLRLSVRDLGQCAQVCKLWNRLSSSDQIWKKFSLSGCFFFKDYKFHTVNVIKSYLPFIRKLNEIPTDLPSFFSREVPYAVSSLSQWNNALASPGDFLHEEISSIDNQQKILLILKIVAKSITFFIHLSEIDFFDLDQAESWAHKTKSTFLNPTPYWLLAESYLKRGNSKKAEEMENHAKEIKNTQVNQRN